MKIKKIYATYIFIYLLLVITFILIPHTVGVNRFLSGLTLICSIYWVYKCWNNTYLLIISVFIAYSNYSIAMGIYFDEALRPRYLYPQIQDVDIYSVGIFMLFLTMLSLATLMPKCKKNGVKITQMFIRKENKNEVMFFALTLLFCIIIVFGYSRASNSRGSSTAIYEYASIILILLFYFSGKNKMMKKICVILCSIYALTSLFNGTRIEALICIIIVLLCYFENGINPALLLTAMIIGLIVFSIVGTIRGNWILLKGNISVFITLLIKNKFVFDTCTHAYFPMLCMIDVFRKFSFSNAIYYFTRFVLTVFLGQSRVNDGNLIQVVGKYFYHNYGCVTPGFFFVWFSYIGSLIYSLIILAYTKLINYKKIVITPVKCSVLIYVVASVPRWYLYGPWSLLRGALICMIFTKIIMFIEKKLRKV